MTQELLQQQQVDQDSSLFQKDISQFTKELITTKGQWAEVLDRLSNVDIFAYDTETNGVFTYSGISMAGLSLSTIDDNEAWACYVPFNHLEGEQLSIDHLQDLKPIFESDIQKICHNTKFDEMVLSRYGIDVAGFGHDTIVQAWLLDETDSYQKLDDLVEDRFGIRKESFEQVISKAPKERGVDRDYNFCRVSLKDALDYAADDSYYDYRLFQQLSKELKADKLWDAYYNIEGRFVRIIRKMEGRGVFIDQEALDFADKRLPKVVEEVEAVIYEAAGEVFNVGSGPQLAHILYEKLKVGKNVPKTKKGQYKTDAKTLKKYAKHEVVANVLRRKKVQKTHSTFVEGPRKFIEVDGRLRPSFNGCGTVTGRLSCSKPNLQQVEGDEVEEIKVRNFFIPTEGYKFIVADYSQIEYRLMAHFSRDKNMLDAFAAGHDFHAETARKAFKLGPDEEVPHRKRFIAKSINFGVGYGRGPGSLAETLGCSWSEAEDYIDDYYETFAGLSKFKKHVISQARKTGYVRTLAGRKRRLLPEIRSSVTWKRNHAERQAFNTKIQGSAADLIKLAMISLQPVLDDMGAFMVIQIHDELVIEAPEHIAEDAVAPIKQVMENPLNGKNPLILPIATEPAIVDRWGDAK